MPSLREAFDANGFVLLEGGIPPELLRELREGLAPILAARRDDVKLDTRFREKLSRPTRHLAILKPDCFHPSFVKFLNLPSLNQAATEIIGTGELSFSGLAVLLGSAEHTLCRWHRDFPDTHAEVPELLRKHPNGFVQYNCALYDDASLWVVPGSHHRPSTREERAWAARFKQLDGAGGLLAPYATAAAIEPNVLRGMPGARHAVLKAGDCLLYNALLWHAAEYRPEWKRATLHGVLPKASLADQYEALRWGLTHNPWLLEPSYLGDPGPYFGPQLKRYQALVRRHAPELAKA